MSPNNTFIPYLLSKSNFGLVSGGIDHCFLHQEEEGVCPRSHSPKKQLPIFWVLIDSCKMDVPNSTFDLKRTVVFEWCMVGCESKNKRPRNMC